MHGSSRVNERSKCLEMSMPNKFGQKNSWVKYTEVWEATYKKRGKNTVKLGKTATNRLKIKEKADILAQENCQNMEISRKRNSHTPECNSLLRSEVMEGSSKVNERFNCSGIPYGYQIWCQESLTKVQHIAGVKCHTGVIWDQPKVKLHRNTPQSLKKQLQPLQSSH